jgi:hypothetical protein
MRSKNRSSPYETFNVTITFSNRMQLKAKLYCRLFDKKEIIVNIMAVDPDKEKQLLNAWLNSKFEK